MKLTKKDFKKLKSLSLNYINLLCLKDWEWQFLFDKKKKNSYARYSYNYQARQVTITYYGNIPDYINKFDGFDKNEMLENIVFHEIMHIRLCILEEIIKKKSKITIESEEHAIIHGVYNLLKKGK